MLDVLVTCLPHADDPILFPQVRGYYLAEHLARLGLRAEFHQLPQPSQQCQVLICSEYQQEPDGFERTLRPYLIEIAADRFFCLCDYSLYDRPDHFSKSYCEWFGERGGVLCHLPTEHLESYETWVGLGVDTDVVGFGASRARDRVLFDFPRSTVEDGSSAFDTKMLDVLRDRLPKLHLVGSGPPDSALRGAFDDWIDYGQPHPQYVAAAFSGVLALVPSLPESLGLAVAEAQVAGACIVSCEGQVQEWLLAPEASVSYTAGGSSSLALALAAAGLRDPQRIRSQASATFDFHDVAVRTRHAIGL